MFKKKPMAADNPVDQTNKVPEEIKPDTAQTKITECEKQKEEYLNGWKRERADFLNYKKEEMERISALMKYANEEIVLKLLPILDNFLLAEKSIPDQTAQDSNVKGLLLINLQLKDFLKGQGIEEIKAVGEKFDPNFHEVVQEVQQDGSEPGIVTEEVQKGYLMQGKVLRVAKVKISKN